MTMETLARIQFAFTTLFHVTFPAVTVGLSFFLTAVYAIYLRTRKPVYLQMFRFWRRIFAVGFALGVVAGAVITFEFGLNWGVYAAKTGPVIAPIIAMEVVTAFFVEAGFIGVLLYGDGRVSPRVMLLASGMVSLGTLLSTTWILAANSWMQTPAGFRIDDHGRFIPVDWLEVIGNPSFGLRFAHMLLAVVISAAVFIAGISAYYLIRDRQLAFARRSFSIGIGVLAILIPVQLSVGDHVALEIIGTHQPAKLAALEGHWHDSSGYNIAVVPDQDAQRNTAELNVPYLGSLIAQDLSGNTEIPGITGTPRDEQPPVWAVFWGFRVMFYASMLLFAAAFASVVLRIRGRLYTSRRFHRFVLWLTPAGIIAIMGGWITAETGRQPYVVYGHLRTDDAVSHLATPELIATVAGFGVLYVAFLFIFAAYVRHTVIRGPERDDPGRRADESDELTDALDGATS